MERIESHNSSSPLFLYVAYQAPHGPLLEPPRRYGRTYRRSRRYSRMSDTDRNRYATITVRQERNEMVSFENVAGS